MLQPRIAIPPLSTAAWAGHERHAPLVDLAGETMGTTWRIRLAAPAGFDRRAMARAVQHRLDGLVLQMSHWRGDSLLSGYGRAAAGRWFVLPPDFAAVMRIGLAVAARSSGAFDPTLGALTRLWGLGPDRIAAPPAVATIAAAITGWRRARFDPGSSRLFQPGGLALDLSGIAKGYAVDAVAALLAGRGIRHCLVEIGGELAGRGLRPDGTPWWVDLEDPGGASGLPPLRIALHGLAVATSGDYVRGAHMIDPATGRLVDEAVAAVTILHPSAAQADAWATALIVLGPRAGLARAAAEGLAARILLRGEAGMHELLSPALEAML